MQAITHYLLKIPQMISIASGIMSKPHMKIYKAADDLLIPPSLPASSSYMIRLLLNYQPQLILALFSFLEIHFGGDGGL